jgi:hypothetical protein
VKKQFISIVVVAACAAILTVTQVRAQDAGKMTVDIPFSFNIAEKTYPAGDYYVRRNISGAQVNLQLVSNDTSRVVNFSVHPVKAEEIQDHSKLIFNKYGTQLFLSQVWMSGRATGEELAKSNRERVARKETSRITQKPETVEVAMRSN